MTSTLTWKEFKELVDREIQEEGGNQDIKISYIDISHPTERRLDVWVVKGELCVSC